MLKFFISQICNASETMYSGYSGSDFPISRKVVAVNLSACSRVGTIVVLVAFSGCRSHKEAVNPASTPASPVSYRASATKTIASDSEYKRAIEFFQRGDVLPARVVIDKLLLRPGLSDSDKKFLIFQQSLCNHALDPKLPDPHAPPPSPTTAPKRLTSEQADCGPRALGFVLQKLGIPSEISRLRKSAGTTGYGTTMEGLRSASTKLGLKAEGVQMDREALLKYDGQAVAWVEGDHYIAILGRHGDSFAVRDPNLSKEETISVDEVLRRSGGVMLKISRP